MRLQRLVILAVLLSPLACAFAQEKSAASPSGQTTAHQPPDPANDPSGMYTFLKDGEFVQLNIEDGKLSGYVSRFGETESDKGQFIDQFFEKATLSGDRLTFTTKVVHGVSYDFKGIVTITPGKLHGQEGYRVLKGTLTQHAADEAGKDKASQKQVELKSFPEDMGHS
jgi:hypothetical protein